MKKHIITIVLLILAAIAFVLSLYFEQEKRFYCDVVAFLFPTIAALVEIILAEKSGKVMEKEIKKLKNNQLSFNVEDETLKIIKGEN